VSTARDHRANRAPVARRKRLNRPPLIPYRPYLLTVSHRDAHARRGRSIVFLGEDFAAGEARDQVSFLVVLIQSRDGLSHMEAERKRRLPT
jgi:hypothetical protein